MGLRSFLFRNNKPGKTDETCTFYTVSLDSDVQQVSIESNEGRYVSRKGGPYRKQVDSHVVGRPALPEKE